MLYPEEPITFCRTCNAEIPIDNFWRGRGSMINASGEETRTHVLFSQCPHCGRRYSVGLEGPWWYLLLYQWLWKLRYPRRMPPQPEVVVMDRFERPHRRAVGE